MRFTVLDKVRRTAIAEGAPGLRWLESLDSVLEGIEAEWGLKIGRCFANATEAFAAEATLADGTRAAIKYMVAGLDPTRREIRALLAAGGRGYVKVLRHDMARGILLLERLGPQLHELGLPLESQIRFICATLREAWRPLPQGLELLSGADKARALARQIEEDWPRQQKPCTSRAVEIALAYAEERHGAFDAHEAVMAHGDAHAWNTLSAPDLGPDRFKLVDPDGLFVERAYDLSISLREWDRELLAGDPYRLGRQRCALLAHESGVEEEPIWQWGFLERLANGLSLNGIGLHEVAGKSLAISDAWAAAL